MIFMDTIRIFRDTAGAWRWHRKAGNGELISQGESHTSKRDAQRAAQRANPDSRWTYDCESRTCDE